VPAQPVPSSQSVGTIKKAGTGGAEYGKNIEKGAGPPLFLLQTLLVARRPAAFSTVLMDQELGTG